MSDGQKRERVGSFDSSTKGISPALKTAQVRKEPDVKCPVCGGGLKRVQGEDGTTSAACPSCGFKWFSRG